MAAPQPQAAPQQPKQQSPRIADVFFKDVATFNSGSISASMGQKDVVGLVPGSIDSTGRVAFASDSGERDSDGILVTLKQRGRDGKAVLRTSLVPWSNIRDVVFEDIELATQAA